MVGITRRSSVTRLTLIRNQEAGWEMKGPIRGRAEIRIEGGGRKDGYPDGARSRERSVRWATGTWMVGDRGEVIRIEGFAGR